MISTFVWMKWPTNAGYAIAPLERLFFDAAVELAQGNQQLVRFGYPDISPGSPRALPEGFTNVTQLNLLDASTGGRERAARYFSEHPTDLIIGFDMQPVHPSFRIARLRGVRSIVSYWGAPISSRMPAWRIALKRLGIRLSRSRVDGLIFESQAMADLALFGRGVPSDMIDVIPLGVDVERFRPAESDHVYRVLGLPRDRKVVVFSGHTTERKGIGTLMEAAIQLLAVRRRADVLFLVCGNKPGESEPYERMVANAGVAEWVRFAGYREDLIEIFQSAYCGVLPSSGWDSFPRSSLEMAATGLPVVASRLQGLAEAVRHQETGLLFEPRNASDLADCLERLLDDPILARQYGRQGRQRCERELTINLQRQRFMRALRRRLTASIAAAQ
jgi:glycosyltransferase involved in cell wall biosynthesis